MTLTVPAAPAAPPRAARYVSDFKQLTERVNADGLMRRAYGFYLGSYALAAGAIAVVIAVMALLGDTWWQLLPAAALGVIFAQLGFLGHEASHRQVFRSARRNAWLGRITSNALVGLSYGWWMSKHSRHHQAPNELGTDPDIENAVVSFSNEATAGRRGLSEWFTRRQGVFFLPLLFLQGLELHAASIKRVLGGRPLKHRWVEITMIAVRLIGFVGVVFWIFPPGLAAAFLGVQVMVFGFLLGGAFAPNHIGMPIVPSGTKIDFVRRQVLMSRNVSGGPVIRFLMGGLDTQIEHHLFPGMPRPHLRRAQAIVRDHCHTQGIRYTETSVWTAYRSVLGHINRVGLAGRDAFTCPLAQQLRA